MVKHGQDVRPSCPGIMTLEANFHRIYLPAAAVTALFAITPIRWLRYSAEAWISLICGALLLAIIWTEREHPTRILQIKLVICMLLCTVIGYFGLQPYMAELRAIAAQSDGIMDDAMRSRFGMLHGVASVIYLIQSVLAVGLVLKSK